MEFTTEVSEAEESELLSMLEEEEEPIEEHIKEEEIYEEGEEKPTDLEKLYEPLEEIVYTVYHEETA